MDWSKAEHSSGILALRQEVVDYNPVVDRYLLREGCLQRMKRASQTQSLLVATKFSGQQAYTAKVTVVSTALLGTGGTTAETLVSQTKRLL